MIGQFLQLLAVSVFTFATVQTFIQPLLEKDHMLQSLLLPRQFFAVAPVAAVFLLAFSAFAFLALKTAQKKKAT